MKGVHIFQSSYEGNICVSHKDMNGFLRIGDRGLELYDKTRFGKIEILGVDIL